MKTKKAIHNNLRLLRFINDDLPQKYVAYKIGISQVAYCKMERGLLNPSEEVITKLCDLYKIETREFIYLPKEEVKSRLLSHPMNVAYNITDNIKMEMDTIRRKLNVMLNNI